MNAPSSDRPTRAAVQAPTAGAEASPQPLAYQRGYQNFYGRDFLVTPDVLIPRPETEQLIDVILTLAGQPILSGVRPPRRILPPRPVIVDVGTGSGCIAVTLALALPEAQVIATDLSPAALKIAQKNAARYNAPITPIISHLLKNVKHKPDLVVANLPYVDHAWPWLDHAALAYEPATALYADDHGLALIKELVAEAASRAVPRLVLEADPCQHAALVAFAARHDYHLEQTAGFALSLIRSLKAGRAR